MNLQQVGGLQVLSDDGIQDHLEDHLDVGGVRCRGEVRVDDLALVQVALHELGLDEAGGSVNIPVGTWEGTEGRSHRRPHPNSEDDSN